MMLVLASFAFQQVGSSMGTDVTHPDSKREGEHPPDPCIQWQRDWRGGSLWPSNRESVLGTTHGLRCSNTLGRYTDRRDSTRGSTKKPVGPRHGWKHRGVLTSFPSFQVTEANGERGTALKGGGA